MKGYVYILTNEHMPGLVKIGRTSREPAGRAAELWQTGVPSPFIVREYVLSPDCVSLESEMHDRFAEQRVSPNREFFSLDHKDACAALIEEHEAQLEMWLSEFSEQYVIVHEMLRVDPVDISYLAHRAGAAPYEVAGAMEMLEPEEIAPALLRFRERMARRRERAAELLASPLQ